MLLHASKEELVALFICIQIADNLSVWMRQSALSFKYGLRTMMRRETVTYIGCDYGAALK
jgi:hypothetical protein